FRTCQVWDIHSVLGCRVASVVVSFILYGESQNAPSVTLCLSGCYSTSIYKRRGVFRAPWLGDCSMEHLTTIEATRPIAQCAHIICGPGGFEILLAGSAVFVFFSRPFK
ncbi:unnamed protein product, partial [Ectocarpus sp. 6 AP-2014]